MSKEAALAIVNARIWTNDPRRPWADAILVRGDRIAVVGSSAEVRKAVGDDLGIIDAKGMMIVPGAVAAGSPAMRAIQAAMNRRPNPDGATLIEIGVLQIGMIADLTMIDHDLSRIATETVVDARVVLTMVRGRALNDRMSEALDHSGHT